MLEARFEESRLEKERAAILSEMSMVNTMDYRVECQILSALHAENKLALRFPIGKEELIRSWKLEDVKVSNDTTGRQAARRLTRQRAKRGHGRAWGALARPAT